MKKYVHGRKRKAFIFDDHIGIFPPEAKEWLTSVGLSPAYITSQRRGWVTSKPSETDEEVFFLRDEWVRYDGFQNKETTGFYVRRWNGRMGREWKKLQLKLKTLTANLSR